MLVNSRLNISHLFFALYIFSLFLSAFISLPQVFEQSLFWFFKRKIFFVGSVGDSFKSRCPLRTFFRSKNFFVFAL